MLDHVFTEAIGALREVLEAALLEPQAPEERFHADVLAGDLSWQTSYSLPGEGSPARVQADIVLEWSTWSQTAYRSWRIGDPVGDPPRVAIEVLLRLQRLVHLPDAAAVLAVLPPVSVTVGAVRLERAGPRVEIGYDADLANPEHAIEVSYEGTCELDEDVLTDPGLLDQHFSSMGGWIASTLVRLGDLDVQFLPPDEEESTP